MRTFGNVLAVALMVGLGLAWWVQDGQRALMGPAGTRATVAAHVQQPAGSCAR
jgi:hypothetical protein